MLEPSQLDFLKKLLRDYEDAVFVVEGKKDERALRLLGIKNTVAISGRSLFDVSEMLGKTERIVILTDFDSEGKKMAAGLERMLMSSDVKIDRNARDSFRRVFKVRQIEELNKPAESLFEGLRGKEQKVRRISG